MQITPTIVNPSPTKSSISMHLRYSRKQKIGETTSPPTSIAAKSPKQFYHHYVFSEHEKKVEKNFQLEFAYMRDTQ